MTLPRGFKTQAECIAEELRAKIGATASKPLDLTAVAEQLDVRVKSAADLVPLKQLQEIERIQTYAFSACTFEINDQHVIVFNPLMSAGRQASDIAHELAHIILDHELAEIQYLDGIPFRTCHPGQEEEATALGGTLLLPRKLLLQQARRGASIESVAKRFGVTRTMAQFRWNTTGVERQVARERSRSRAQS